MEHHSIRLCLMTLEQQGFETVAAHSWLDKGCLNQSFASIDGHIFRGQPCSAACCLRTQRFKEYLPRPRFKDIPQCGLFDFSIFRDNNGPSIFLQQA